ncbi:HAD-IIB family hydrolase [Amphibacillus sp. Q70]|uniref:HAD-IIB family hydrolase n=1 Tax=Amphibacillus sp. Q70 TaxID=3453416 RepID=UPI003F84D004
MMKIKRDLMMIDIDGTFVFNSSEVAKKDLEAFNEAKDHCSMAIATGRSVKEIEFIEQENNITLDYKIGFNGALIVDTHGEIIYDRPIIHETLVELIDYLAEQQIIFDSLDGKTRFGNFAHEAQNQLLGLEYLYLEDPYSMAKSKKIYKVNLRPDSFESANKITSELKERFPSLSIFQVGKKRIEISAANTSKGLSLIKIAPSDGETIAIGDSENDISMFKEAKTSYCMEHAPEYVRAYANYTVPRFHDAIDHFLQRKEQKVT